MSSTTYRLHSAAALSDSGLFVVTQGVRRAARLLSGFVLVGLLAAAVTLVIMAISAHSTPQTSVWPWFGAWAVAVVGLIIASRVKGSLTRGILTLLVEWRARRIQANTERAIALAVRDDPRMRQELQILRDHMQWRDVRVTYHN